MKTKLSAEFINILRKIITKPKLKTRKEAYDDVEKFLQRTHNINAIDSIEGRKLIGELQKIGGLEPILKYIMPTRH